MRTLTHHARSGILFFTLATTTLLACSPPPPATNDDEIGTVGFALQVAAGVTINSISWSITNAAPAFSRSGTVNVQNSNTIRFQVGGVPAGTGYAISLSAMSADGGFACSGAASFAVVAGMTSTVAVTLTCTANGNGSGTVVVGGTTEVCATITSLTVLPLETTVGNPIMLSATANAGPVTTPTFAWSAPAGSFDNAASATPTFTCPTTPGPVLITLNVSPGGAGCPTSTRSVEVTCDTLNPTFTNVYANVIGARCTGCHRPGGSGVNAGQLDMSTQVAAYANLVGVLSAGTGAGASGITCASIAMPRVKPSDSAGSLLYNKVATKLAGTMAACGSPMPLPGAATPLTQAQVNLIAAWIDAGALND